MRYLYKSALMHKLFTLLLVLFSFSGITAQKDVPTVDTLKNMIALAPVNTNLFGTSNMIYYKRFINQRGHSQIYYRVGLGVLNRFTFEDDADRSLDDKTLDQRNLNFNFGLEWYRPIGKFSITFGQEIGYTRSTFINEYISIGEMGVFSVDGLSRELDLSVEDAFYRSYNIHLFTGLRYRVGQHFQFGLESALGWSFYRVENRYPESSSQTDRAFIGTIRELALPRHFILEVNF